MSKITRATQKLFGSSGITSDFGEFGSLAAGTPTTTKDPATIQSLAAWLSGWAAATIGTLIPAYQDMNSVCYLAFYQICYLLQMGVAEYDASTTYYTNSVAQFGGQFYVSKVDNNTGNEPDTSPTQWQSGLPGAETTGVIKQFAGSVAPSGYLICDGTAVSRSTYAALFGVCGTNYGPGDGSTTFNIPDLRTRIGAGYKSGDANFGTLGQSGGAKTVDSSHTHTVPNTGWGDAGPGTTSGTLDAGPDGGGGSIHQTANGVTSGVGGSAALSVLQPYLTVNHIIKY